MAVAQFAGGALPFHQRVISVSLVAPNLMSGKEKRSPHDDSMQRGQPIVRRIPERTAQQREDKLRDISSDLQPPAASAEEQEAIAGGEQNQVAASADAREGGNDAIGPAPSEHWAAIAAALERSKNYPRLARERGIEGVVKLRFKVNISGAVEKVEIVESSGSELLDNASVRAVNRAAPLPYVKGWVEMPMKYVLK